MEIGLNTSRVTTSFTKFSLFFFLLLKATFCNEREETIRRHAVVVSVFLCRFSSYNVCLSFSVFFIEFLRGRVLCPGVHTFSDRIEER